MNHKLAAVISIAFIVLAFLPHQALAASPVRLSITADSDSGIEQEIVDYISEQFSDDPNIEISTVNPDWYVLCHIVQNLDRMGGQIRYNGTVTIKTSDGQVVSTVSAQKYNQDFSLQSGEPFNTGAPLNKQLVDSAARDVISAIGARAAAKIKEAVPIELKARDQIAQAEALANDDKYDEAISALGNISLNTVHFRDAQKRIAVFKMEKQALELVHNAEAKAKQARYSEAIALLKEVDPRSKNYKHAKQLSARYRSQLELARTHTKSLAKNKDASSSASKSATVVVH